MTKVFACYNKNDDVRMISSSGGMYYLLAEKVINKGGIVYGACYEGTEVVHHRIETIDGIPDSCGSKYIPSKLNDTFLMIRKDLKDGKKVLFTGTPCQCAGLKSFIGNNDNLYLADFICHGMPSKTAWNAYLDSLKKNGQIVTGVNMRNKSSGWLNYSWVIKDQDNNEIRQSHNDNKYMKGFIADLYLRPSCYTCHFKGVERVTDFTMGDYWGVQSIQPDMYDDKGTSLFFVHSDKGMELFEEIQNQIVYKEADVERAIKANPSIVSCAKTTKKREQFFSRINANEDFIEVVSDLTKVTLQVKVKRKAKNMIKKILGGGY